MSTDTERERLHAEHRPAAVAERIAGRRGPGHLGDAVLGAIDGCVTTFAIVAGAAGAGLPRGVALVLGFSNLVADGFSMAASNFERARSDRDQVARARAQEREHVEHVPEGEREEVRQILVRQGLEGDDLRKVLEVITAERERWVEFMLIAEHGLHPNPASPLRAAGATLAAFVVVGAVPLLPLLVAADAGLFAASAAATAAAFLGIGALQGKLTGMRPLGAALRTLAVGGSAALLAYGVAALLRDVATA